MFLGIIHFYPNLTGSWHGVPFRWPVFFVLWVKCYKTHYISCTVPNFCIPLHLEKIRIFIHRFIIYFYFARCEARKLIVRFVKNTRHSAKFGELFFVFMADSKFKFRKFLTCQF